VYSANKNHTSIQPTHIRISCSQQIIDLCDYDKNTNSLRESCQLSSCRCILATPLAATAAAVVRRRETGRCGDEDGNDECACAESGRYNHSMTSALSGQVLAGNTDEQKTTGGLQWEWRRGMGWKRCETGEYWHRINPRLDSLSVILHHVTMTTDQPAAETPSSTAIAHLLRYFFQAAVIFSRRRFNMF